MPTVKSISDATTGPRPLCLDHTSFYRQSAAFTTGRKISSPSPRVCSIRIENISHLTFPSMNNDAVIYDHTCVLLQQYLYRMFVWQGLNSKFIHFPPSGAAAASMWMCSYIYEEYFYLAKCLITTAHLIFAERIFRFVIWAHPLG